MTKLNAADIIRKMPFPIQQQLMEFSKNIPLPFKDSFMDILKITVENAYYLERVANDNTWVYTSSDLPQEGNAINMLMLDRSIIVGYYTDEQFYSSFTHQPVSKPIQWSYIFNNESNK